MTKQNSENSEQVLSSENVSSTMSRASMNKSVDLYAEHVGVVIKDLMTRMPIIRQFSTHQTQLGTTVIYLEIAGTDAVDISKLGVSLPTAPPALGPWQVMLNQATQQYAQQVQGNSQFPDNRKF